jgi:hypothetical protein
MEAVMNVDFIKKNVIHQMCLVAQKNERGLQEEIEDFLSGYLMVCEELALDPNSFETRDRIRRQTGNMLKQELRLMDSPWENFND